MTDERIYRGLEWYRSLSDDQCGAFDAWLGRAAGMSDPRLTAITFATPTSGELELTDRETGEVTTMQHAWDEPAPDWVIA